MIDVEHLVHGADEGVVGARRHVRAAAVPRQVRRDQIDVVDALQLRGLARSLEAVSPLATIARGYSILQRDDGQVVRGTGDVAAGDAVSARVVDGRLRLRVEDVEGG